MVDLKGGRLNLKVPRFFSAARNALSPPEFYHYRVLWAMIERLEAGDSVSSVAEDFGADPQLVRALRKGAKPT